MKQALVLLVIALVVIFAVWRSMSSNTVENEVTVEALSNHNLQASILASGKISHEDEVLLSTEVIGKVTELFVEEGDHVDEGQLVLRIDDEAILATVQQTEATVRMQEIGMDGQAIRIRELENQFSRNKRLFDSGLLDQDSFDAIGNQLELARIDLLSRQQQLAQAKANLE